ncbi:MAG TPA: hypothetical protein VE890_00370 [Thermoguttaceae bacterium]|nr:hypothetical protein [Thermoguttaceae bacterium]
MIQTIFQYKRSLAAGLALLLVSVSGCGTGEYERRLSSATQKLKQNSAFADMKPSAPLTGVSVKIPNSFQSQPLTEATQVDGQPIDPRRVQPPVVQMSGLQWTYEEQVEDDSGGKLSYYCYLATIDVASQGNIDPMDLVRRQAQTKYPKTTSAVESVQCPTPQGQTVEWKRLRCSGDQEFYYVDPNGNADFRPMLGAMEFYGRKEGDTIILIGWRVPMVEDGKAYVDIQAWTERVAGSVTAP